MIVSADPTWGCARVRTVTHSFSLALSFLVPFHTSRISLYLSRENIGAEIVAVFNKLQDVHTVASSVAQIDLPQICVSGSQSSGKSSLLEVHRHGFTSRLRHRHTQPSGMLF